MNATEQQRYDSDTIFTQITEMGGFASMDEVRATVALFYVPDMSISRAGISHALKRLEKHFAKNGVTQ